MMARETIPESITQRRRQPSTPTSPLSPVRRPEPVWRLDSWPLDDVPYELAPALPEEEGADERVAKLVKEVLQLRKRGREHEILQRCFLVTAACCRPPRGAPRPPVRMVQQELVEEEDEADWSLEDELWPDLAGLPDNVAQAEEWDRERKRRRKARAIELTQARRPILAGSSGSASSTDNARNSDASNRSSSLPAFEPAKATFPAPSSSGQLTSLRRVAKSSGKSSSQTAKQPSQASLHKRKAFTPALTIDPARILAPSTSTIEQQVSKTPRVIMPGLQIPSSRERSMTIGAEMEGGLDDSAEETDDEDAMDTDIMAETQVPKRSEKAMQKLAKSRSNSSLQGPASTDDEQPSGGGGDLLDFLVEDNDWPSS